MFCLHSLAEVSVFVFVISCNYTPIAHYLYRRNNYNTVCNNIFFWLYSIFSIFMYLLLLAKHFNVHLLCKSKKINIMRSYITLPTALSQYFKSIADLYLEMWAFIRRMDWLKLMLCRYNYGILFFLRLISCQL